MIHALEMRDGGVVSHMRGHPASCHPDRPEKTRGLCASCYLKWLKAHNPQLAERQRANCRRWMKKNKARAIANHARYIAKQDPGWRWARSLYYRFGMTPDDYQRLLDAQGGACAICGKTPALNKHLHIDHDHATGIVRGLLCFRCNFGLSYFAEDAARFLKAYNYLSKEKT